MSFLFANFEFGYGQSRLNKLVQSLITADSVWIVSHSETLGVTIRDENDSLITRPLVENDKLNKKAIKEQYLLNNSEIKRLSVILGRPKKDTKIEMAKCFIPYHGLIWKTKGKLLWIEIAFDCNRVEPCKEISISEYDFDEHKWKELAQFYKQKGIRYNL